jgi:uncharacterized membrane protein
MQGYIAQVIPDRRPIGLWLSTAAALSLLVSLIVIAPVAAAGGHSDVAQGIYRAFGTFCHQRPDRSYFIDGHKFAVCSRCTGLYFGFALTFLLYPLIRSLRNATTPPRIYLLLAAIPLAIDFSLTFFGVWENTHTSRLLTGALLGGAAVFYVVPGLIELSMRSKPARPAEPTFTLASPERIASAPSDYSAPERRI